MIRTTTAFLLGAASVALVSAPEATRFERLAAETPETAKEIEQLPVSLVKAVQIAQEAVEGHASSAKLTFIDEKPRYTVDVYGAKASARVVVDGTSGKVAEREPLYRIPGTQVEGEPTVTESGLMFWDIKVGEGTEVPSPNAMVRYHVNGYLTDGTLFDSTYLGQPRMYPLDRVFAGFREGVSSMNAGGKRKLIMPYNLAFGEHGNPPVVPHRAMIIYDVELLEVVP